MFYSHQLLARKAPLGQIWRAATLHAKINRRNLNKLNIINICEEILNPSVPMALRLSGILMGGVVIVYERKVKLLYEDVTRLLVELNEAWKVKLKRDPTVLPKGKTQAKFEAVTLQDDQMSDLNDLEETLLFSNSDTLMGIHKSAYTEMNLDNIDDSYISHNKGGADLPHDHHQADIENITMCDKFDSYHADPSLFNQFERFDIEGDDIGVTGEKFPSHTHTDPPPENFVPSPPLQDVPSPPLQDVPQKPDEIPEQHPGDQVNPQFDEDKVPSTPKMQRPPRRRGRRGPTTLMDYEQTMIPGQMYQSWLQDTSDIVSRRGKKRKHMGSLGSIKIARLMDLPPVSLVCGLVTNGTPDIYYPLPLLQQWMKITGSVHDSPSGGASPPHPPAPSSSSPPHPAAPSSSSPPAPPPAPPVTNNYDDQTTVPFEDNHSGAASGSSVPSIHKFRAERSTEILRRELETDLMNNGINVTEANGRTGPEADLIVTPRNSGDGVKKAASSGSEHGFVSLGSDLNSGRSNKKRLFSSSRQSGSSLPPVAEDFPWDHPDPNYKLNELNENDLPETDLMVETGPTQTQKFPSSDQPLEHLTDSIRMQLKSYFDTPGSAQTESLNQLAVGLDRKRAACLFYQTCVLATRDFIKVEQRKPYGDILISRGRKM